MIIRRRQAGAALLLFVIAISVLAAAVFLAQYLKSGQDQTARITASLSQFVSIERALLAYAASNGRLPCPAAGNTATGEAEPAGAATACTAPTGIVPWKSLGLKQDDVLDDWGNRISYRVFSGTTGLTQSGGASMTSCVKTVTTGCTNSTGADGLCTTSPIRNTGSTTFLTGKGRKVTDYGTLHSDAAYVLISHGKTGRGAWTKDGIQRELPTTGGNERDNTTETGHATNGFVYTNASAAADDPASSSFFDDLIAYASVSDIINKANQGPRDWPSATCAPMTTLTFDRTTVEAASGLTITAGSDVNLGVTTLTFAGATITGFNTSGNQTLSFNTAANMVEGIGVSGTGSISSASGEGLLLSIGGGARKLGISLNRFGTSSSSFERAEFRFYDSTATLISTQVKSACATGSPLTSFSTIEAPADFASFEIRALINTAGTAASTFYLSALIVCPSTATSCESPLLASSTLCP